MNVDRPLAAGPRDHGPCIETALDGAAMLCERRGVRLAARRRRVPELICLVCGTTDELHDEAVRQTVEIAGPYHGRGHSAGVG